MRCLEQQTSFSHIRPNGTSCFTVLGKNGVSYSGAGEHIANGQRTPEAVVTAWMNSPGHKANVLSPSYKNIGVGVYIDPYGRVYWTQLFTY